MVEDSLPEDFEEKYAIPHDDFCHQQDLVKALDDTGDDTGSDDTGSDDTSGDTGGLAIGTVDHHYSCHCNTSIKGNPTTIPSTRTMRDNNVCEYKCHAHCDRTVLKLPDSATPFERQVQRRNKSTEYIACYNEHSKEVPECQGLGCASSGMGGSADSWNWQNYGQAVEYINYQYRWRGMNRGCNTNYNTINLWNPETGAYVPVTPDMNDNSIAEQYYGLSLIHI